MSDQFNKYPIGFLFRRMREEKGLLIRQVAAVTELDQALISHIENGNRLPTREQVIKLAGLYNLDIGETMSAWLAERVVRDYGEEPYISEALREAHERVLFSLNLASEPISGQAQPYDSSSVKSEEIKGPGRKPRRRNKNSGK